MATAVEKKTNPFTQSIQVYRTGTSCLWDFVRQNNTSFLCQHPPPPTDKQTNTRTSSLCYCCPLCPLVIDLITAHQKHRYDYTAKQTTTWRRHNKLQRSDSELRKKTRPVMYGVTGGGGGRRQGDVSGRLGSCRGHRGWQMHFWKTWHTDFETRKFLNHFTHTQRKKMKKKTKTGGKERRTASSVSDRGRGANRQGTITVFWRRLLGEGRDTIRALLQLVSREGGNSRRLSGSGCPRDTPDSHNADNGQSTHRPTTTRAWSTTGQAHSLCVCVPGVLHKMCVINIHTHLR